MAEESRPFFDMQNTSSTHDLNFRLPCSFTQGVGDFYSKNFYVKMLGLQKWTFIFNATIRWHYWRFARGIFSCPGSKNPRSVTFYLEDRPMTCEWIIGPWWSLLVPKGSGCGSPSKFPKWLINGGDPITTLTKCPSSHAAYSGGPWSNKSGWKFLWRD